MITDRLVACDVCGGDIYMGQQIETRRGRWGHPVCFPTSGGDSLPLPDAPGSGSVSADAPGALIRPPSRG